MALWKARSLSTEQKMLIVEESEEKTLNSYESGSFLGIEDANMSEVFSSAIPVPVSSFSLYPCVIFVSTQNLHMCDICLHSQNGDHRNNY